MERLGEERLATSPVHLELLDTLGHVAEMSELDGVLALQLAAAGAGLTQSEIINALSGDLSIDLTDGVYRGVDLWYEISKARARIRRKSPPCVQMVGDRVCSGRRPGMSSLGWPSVRLNPPPRLCRNTPVPSAEMPAPMPAPCMR